MNFLTPFKAMQCFRLTVLGIGLLVLGAVFTSLPLGGEVSTTHAQEATVPPEGGTPAESTTASNGSSFSEGKNKNIWDSTWGCITNPGQCAADTALVPLGVITYVFLALANVLLSIAAAAFEFAISTFVFKFAVYFGNSAGLLVGWAMMRDIGNILLVFGFVAIGIQTILNVGHYSVGKTLPRLVIFAVLLNFSLFAAEAIIDATNAVASTIFEQAYECGAVGEDCTSGAITNKVMALTGISSLVDPIGSVATFFGNGEKLQRIIAATLGTLFVTVTTIVFAMGALMLLSRAIVLAFLMITAPIGFAGMVIPQLNKVANEWWKTLINNALFAPTLLLLIFVSLKVAEGVAIALSVNGKAPNIFDALFQSTLNKDFGGLLIYLLTVGFLFGSLLAAKQFGIIGSDWAVSTAGKTIGFSTAGLFARAGRYTLGRPLNRMATVVRSRYGNTLAGDLVAKGLDLGAKRTFDIRGAKGNIKVAGVSLGKVGDFSKDGRPGELKKIAERASKDAEEVKKARDTRDNPLKQQIAAAEKAKELEEAKAFNLNTAASDAAARGETDLESKLKAQAATHTARATEIEKEKEDLKEKLKERQLNRLSADDQILQKYKGQGGKAATEDLAQSEALAKNTAQMAEATTQIGKLTESIEKMQTDLSTGRVRDEAATRANIAAAMKQLDAAQAQKEAAEAERATLEADFNKREKQRNKDRASEMKSGAAMLKSDYALDQAAARFEKVARMLEGARIGPISAPLNATAFRTMAKGIRKKAGMSEEEELAHKLEHLLHKKGGHDDHAEEHHEPEPKKDSSGGGGGSHTPAH